MEAAARMTASGIVSAKGPTVLSLSSLVSVKDPFLNITGEVGNTVVNDPWGQMTLWARRCRSPLVQHRTGIGADV